MGTLVSAYPDGLGTSGVTDDAFPSLGKSTWTCTLTFEFWRFALICTSGVWKGSTGGLKSQVYSVVFHYPCKSFLLLLSFLKRFLSCTLTASTPHWTLRPEEHYWPYWTLLPDPIGTSLHPFTVSSPTLFDSLPFPLLPPDPQTPKEYWSKINHFQREELETTASSPNSLQVRIGLGTTLSPFGGSFRGRGGTGSSILHRVVGTTTLTLRILFILSVLF